VRSLCPRCRIRDSVVISPMPQLRTGLFGMLWFAATLHPVDQLEDVTMYPGTEWFGVATSGRQTCIDLIDVEALSRYESPPPRDR